MLEQATMSGVKVAISQKVATIKEQQIAKGKKNYNKILTYSNALKRSRISKAAM